MRARAPALALATLLTACSTPSPRPPAGGTVARGEPAPRPPGARSGGYYLDDGPGENAPANLDAIPDAVPRAESLIARANRPYTVFDRQYAPMTQLAPYRERGVASWYGRKYHGQRTSSGEVYDMYAMTAAHPTLPIPSYARVTNLSNGRAVVVRVNDRGPFLYGRVVDLSYTAAARLGYVASGSTDVEVELITRFDVPAPMAAPAGGQVALGAPAAIGASAGAASAAPVVASSAASAASAAASAASAKGSLAAAVPSQRMPIAAGASSATLVGGTDAPAPERLDVETVVTPAPGASPPAAPAARPPSAPAPSPSSLPAVAPSSAPAAGTSSAPAASPPAAPSAQAAVPAAAGSVFLQLGAFTTRENAEASRARLARQLDWLAERIEVRADGGMFKVQAGPYAQRDDALAAAERVRLQTGFKPFAVSR